MGVMKVLRHPQNFELRPSHIQILRFLDLQAIARALHVSHTTVLRTMKKFAWHPYHCTVLQGLEPDDYHLRLNALSQKIFLC